MKASSESGLWATLISRTSADELLLEALGDCSETTLMCETPTYRMSCDECALLCGLPCRRHARALALFESAPANCNRGGEHHFDHASGNKPIQPEMGRLCQRMRQKVKPSQTPGEQQDRG